MSASSHRWNRSPSRLVMNPPSDTPPCRAVLTTLREGMNRLGKPMKMCGARK